MIALIQLAHCPGRLLIDGLQRRSCLCAGCQPPFEVHSLQLQLSPLPAINTPPYFASKNPSSLQIPLVSLPDHSLQHLHRASHAPGYPTFTQSSENSSCTIRVFNDEICVCTGELDSVGPSRKESTFHFFTSPDPTSLFTSIPFKASASIPGSAGHAPFCEERDPSSTANPSIR